MKKVIILLVSISMCFLLFNTPKVKADDNYVEENPIIEDLVIVSSETIDLNNGEYIVSTLYEEVKEEKKHEENEFSLLVAPPFKIKTYEKRGMREVIKYTPSDDVLWVFTVYGFFLVTPGINCECTNATYSAVSNTSVWTFSDGEAWFYGNTARAKGTYTGKILFVTLSRVFIDITVSCDENGNLDW